MLDFHGTMAPLISAVVDSVHSSFPDHYDKSDTESTLWVVAYERKTYFEEMIRSNERHEGPLKYLLTKEANAFLKKEDAVAYGYSSDDVLLYSTKVIKTLLPNIFDYEDWQSFGLHGDGQPTAKGQVNMTGDVIAAMTDIKAAVEKLREPQYNIILWIYKYNYTHQNLADELGINLEAAHKRSQGAIKALRKLLGEKPLSEMRKGYSGRTDPTNTASGVAQAERDYEG